MLETDYLLVQLVNTFFYASILFLIASGLSLIYGIMRILNLAHGALYMLGAYIAYTVVMTWLGPSPASFVLGFAASCLALLGIGVAVERLVIKPIYGKPEELQLLLTFALILVLDDVVKIVWGPEYKAFTVLPGGSVGVGRYSVPAYMLWVIALGLAVAAGLWYFFSRTTLGKQMRAAAYNPEVAATLGMNTDKLFALAFGLGSALSGLAGAAAAPILTAYPGMGTDAIVMSFAVIVIGGMGSILGSLVGSMVVAAARTLMVNLYPVLEVALVYMVMAAILLVRPVGLFGREEVERR
jgi:branched-chain amino acid transport system permease protein